MARKTRKIEYADFRDGVGFDLNQEQKNKVAASCRLSIEPEIWEEILQATSRYTVVQSSLGKAADVKIVKKELKQFEKAAIGLRISISAREVAKFDPLDVAAQFERLPGAAKSNLFTAYLALLDWMISYTATIQKLHAAGFVIGYKGNGAWQEWVAELATIIKRRGFAVEAMRYKKSPFQSLIGSLQMHMTSDCRRFEHSERSLSEGIRGALRPMTK